MRDLILEYCMKFDLGRFKLERFDHEILNLRDLIPECPFNQRLTKRTQWQVDENPQTPNSCF